MSTRTTYYNLTKPDADEHVLRTVINQNYDAIDLQMHANAEAAKEAAHIPADEYDTTATYNEGDFCIYQNTLYKCSATTTGVFDPTKWQATTISAAFEPKHTWSLFETITADGTDRFVYSSDLPENVSGIIINNVTQAAASAQTLSLGITFNGTTWETVGAIGSALNTDVRYSRFYYTKDGNMWTNKSIAATPSDTSSGGVSERYNSIIIGGDLKNARVYAPTNEVIPSGSTFEIYIRR